MGDLLQFPRRRPLIRVLGEGEPRGDTTPSGDHAAGAAHPVSSPSPSTYDRRVNLVKASRFEDFVRELAEAQARLLGEPGIRLTDDELEALQRHVDPWRCDRCGEPVYPKHSLWWSAVHGGLHMLECEPRPLEAV